MMWWRVLLGRLKTRDALLLSISIAYGVLICGLLLVLRRMVPDMSYQEASLVAGIAFGLGMLGLLALGFIDDDPRLFIGVLSLSSLLLIVSLFVWWLKFPTILWVTWVGVLFLLSAGFVYIFVTWWRHVRNAD